MNFKLLTPQKTIVDNQISNAVIPGAEGYIGFLEGHVPYVTPLKTGVIEISDDLGQHLFAASGGYCEVSSLGIVVLAEYAQAKEDIDPEVARDELKNTDEAIAQSNEDDDITTLLKKKEWAEIKLELVK